MVNPSENDSYQGFDHGNKKTNDPFCLEVIFSIHDKGLYEGCMCVIPG